MSPESSPKRDGLSAQLKAGQSKFGQLNFGRLKAFLPAAVIVVLVAVYSLMTGPKPASLLKDAAASFAKIKRGTFVFQIGISSRGTSSTAGQSGVIRLGGPFELL